MIINKEMLDMDNVTTKAIKFSDGSYDREFKRGDFGRHFKGMIIQFIGYGKNTETEEEYAVYEVVSLEPERKIWIRPKEMFLGEVDTEKYPEVTQKYRIEKIYLEKKHDDSPISSTTLDRSSASSIIYAIRELFNNGYRPENNEHIQAWTADNDPNNLTMERPLNNVQYVGNPTKPANLKFDKGRLCIEFQTETAKETMLEGDVFHMITNYRFAIENKKYGKYEFFEVVPGVSNPY
jgi:hypothetical protein